MEPLESFFANYPNFTYDSSAPARSEFRRLCQAQQWGQNSAQRDSARSRFRTALILQFNAAYGDDLDGWHAMMIHMGVDPLPDTISACKKVLIYSPFEVSSSPTSHSTQIVKGLFVNLVDLVDVRGDPTQTVTLFESEKALSKYTKRTDKFFPKDEAKAGGILKFLLRQIMRPGRRRG